MEEKLIEKLRNGDSDSIKIIMDRYNRKLFSLAYRFTNNYDDTEDILQDVWMKFLFSLKNFKGKSSLYTYLYRIAVNESLNWLRKNKLKRLITEPFIEKEDKTTPEDIYLKNEKLEYLNMAIQRLPSKQKKVFLLRQDGSLHFKEIAEVLNIKENNAKTLFFYSLKNIKKYLKELKIL